MVRWLVGIMVIATLVGVMMPAPRAPVAAPASAAQAEPWFQEPGPSTASFAEGASEVRLDRRTDGHFYAEVDVNGTPTEFLIDTGASGIAITEAAARKAGVRLDDAQRSYVGEGAGGSLTGRRVTLNRVRLGPRDSSGMDAVVIDGARTNLLGQSFLTRFEEVTVRGDTMTMR